MKKMDFMFSVMLLVGCSSDGTVTYKINKENYIIDGYTAYYDECVVIEGKYETHFTSNENIEKTISVNKKNGTVKVETKQTVVNHDYDLYVGLSLMNWYYDNESGKKFNEVFVKGTGKIGSKTYYDTKEYTKQSDELSIQINQHSGTYVYPKSVNGETYLGKYSDYQELKNKSSDYSTMLDYVALAKEGSEYCDYTKSKFFPIVTQEVYNNESKTGKLESYEPKWLISYTNYKKVKEEISWKTITIKL